VAPEVGPLGEVLPEQPIGVLVGAQFVATDLSPSTDRRAHTGQNPPGYPDQLTDGSTGCECSVLWSAIKQRERRARGSRVAGREREGQAALRATSRAPRVVVRLRHRHAQLTTRVRSPHASRSSRSYVPAGSQSPLGARARAYGGASPDRRRSWQHHGEAHGAVLVLEDVPGVQKRVERSLRELGPNDLARWAPIDARVHFEEWEFAAGHA